MVVDDDAAERQGFDHISTAVGPFVGNGYRHDGGTDRGKQSARYTPELPARGEYQVRMSYTPNPNRATNVPVTIVFLGGRSTMTINQRRAPSLDRAFVLLGTFPFDKGKSGSVEISNKVVDGYVVIDAIQWIPVKE